MFKFVKNNFLYLCKKSFSVANGILAFISVILTCLSFFEISIKKFFSNFDVCVPKCEQCPNILKKFCVISIVLLAFLIIYIIFFIVICVISYLKKENVIYEKNNAKITISYGDIFNLKKSNGRKDFVVIPVDTQFHTKVDEDPLLVENPCVSPNTLHGLFIKKFDDEDSLKKQISEFIEKQEYQDSSELKSKYPNSSEKYYKQGSVVCVKKNEKNYLLLALSIFDENYTAYSSKEDFPNVIKGLLKFYDKKCQGGNLYIPLMGTGFSRMELTKQEALKLLLSCLVQNLELIHGEVNIIVNEKDRDSVSIFNIFGGNL